jgi:dihydroxyacid dehydratase/phosphogluconate dehydratase
MILGGSTNAVLHLIAMAHSVGLKLTIDDFQNVSDRIPFLADIKPSGKYVMEDVYKIGGIPSTSSKIRNSFRDLALTNPIRIDRDITLFTNQKPN